MKYTLCVVFLIYSASFSAQSHGEERKEGCTDREIALLGVYHFDSPGYDTYNVDAGNHLSKRKQREIKDVCERLLDYGPSKIFVEWPPEEQIYLDSLYRLYLSGQLVLDSLRRGANEVFQLGFRLGKKLGGIDIIAVDHKGPWLGDYADFIADTLDDHDYNKYRMDEMRMMDARHEAIKNKSLLQNLKYLNNWENVLQNHEYYNDIAVKVRDTVGILFEYQQMVTEIDGYEYSMKSFDFNNVGVELVSEWYKRNLFIYRNILDEMVKDDKGLVIIGSGHVRHLHQFFQDNSDIKVVDINGFLE